MTLDNGTDGQTDRQTDRVRRNMRPPPREEGRIIIDLRAAIRIMCSEDKPAPSSDNIYAQLPA